MTPRDWTSEYQSKLVAPEVAVAAIRSGERIFLTLGYEPVSLLTALAARAGDLANVEVITQRPSEFQVWFGPGVEESFTGSIHSVGGGAFARSAFEGRRADYYPTLLSKAFKAIDERPSEALPVDAFLCSVSPPDEDGYCSFGLRLWHKPSFVRRARLTLAEIDPAIPRIRASHTVHVSEIDYFVEKQVEAMPREPRQPDATTLRIAGFIHDLIQDGDTIEIGGGSSTFPLPALGIFEGKRDLGWHAEITPFGVVTAMRQGIITGARKTVNRGKLVTTNLNVGPGEHDFVANNPDIEIREVTYVNDIQVIAAHDNMVAINNAFAVDLTGQIASEALGPVIWNGMGGQPEFAIGAFLSKGGRSITVLPSVTSTGISRICGQLAPGSYVTVPRYFADLVVTEWGVARLLGKSQRQRAQELINIAHPDHRPALKQMAGKLFWP